jgi:hypothetical protein
MRFTIFLCERADDAVWLALRLSQPSIADWVHTALLDGRADCHSTVEHRRRPCRTTRQEGHP